MLLKVYCTYLSASHNNCQWVYTRAHAILMSPCMLVARESPALLFFPKHFSLFGGAHLAAVQTAVTQMTGSPHYQSGIPRLVGI